MSSRIVRNGVRRLAALTAGGAALLACALLALPASASADNGPLNWGNAFQADGPAPRPDLIAVSCPSSSLCVAIDSAGNIVTSGNPGGGPAAWSRVQGLTIIPNVNSVEASPLDDDLTCPSTQLCVTSEGGQLLVSTNPRGGAAAWQVVGGLESGNATFINAVSCPSAQLCFATDVHPPDLSSLNSYTSLLVSTNPAGGPLAWSTAARLPSSAEFTSGLACVSTKLCVTSGGNGSVVASTDPLGGGWHGAGNVHGSMEDVSCPSVKLCVGTDFTHALDISADPASGHWSSIGRYATYVTCPSTSLCVGAGGPGTGVLYSTNPTGGPGAWGEAWQKNFGTLQYNSVSCASTSFCVAVGQGGLVIVGSRGVQKPKRHKPSGGRKRRHHR